MSSSNTNVNAFGIMDIRDDVSVNVASMEYQWCCNNHDHTGLTETNGTYAIVYDSSHGTALTSDGVLYRNLVVDVRTVVQANSHL